MVNFRYNLALWLFSCAILCDSVFSAEMTFSAFAVDVKQFPDAESYTVVRLKTGEAVRILAVRDEFIEEKKNTVYWNEVLYGEYRGWVPAKALKKIIKYEFNNKTFQLPTGIIDADRFTFESNGGTCTIEISLPSHFFNGIPTFSTQDGAKVMELYGVAQKVGSQTAETLSKRKYPREKIISSELLSGTKKIIYRRTSKTYAETDGHGVITWYPVEYHIELDANYLIRVTFYLLDLHDKAGLQLFDQIAKSIELKKCHNMSHGS